MDIELVFKIAAIGIIVAVLNQLLIRSGRGGSGHDDHIGGACGSALHSRQADQHPVCHHPVSVCAMSAAVPVLTALLLTAFAGILLQRYSPAFALLLSLGAAVWLLLRLAQPLRGVLQAMVQLGQRTNAQAFSCLLRSAGILLLADYVRTLCEEAGADALAWCAGLAGRCLVLAAVWPLLEQIFQTIWGLAG